MNTARPQQKNQGPLRGCSVTITPHEDVWPVSLNADALKTVSMRTYHELPEAIEAVHDTLALGQLCAAGEGLESADLLLGRDRFTLPLVAFAAHALVFRVGNGTP